MSLSRILLAVALLLTSLSLVGCAAFRRMEGLSVSLVNVRLVEATLLETTADFTVRLENELPEEIVLQGGVHKFCLDGAYIGQGLSDETVTVPRLSAVTQRVTVYLRNLSVARRVKPIVEQQRFDYRVDSVLYVEQAGKRGRARISDAGQLDLREFQPTRTPGY